jgi:uncharacterized membrane protein YraQ (UPF0718 family)
MNIVIGTLALMGLAIWVWQKLEIEQNRKAALAGVYRMVRNNMPRLVVALVSAGLFAELLPQEVVRQYLGDTSGFYGVLLGCLLGILTPGGAFVSFALAAGASEVGASSAALVAYICAWALFALTKVIAEELAFLGAQFIVTRFAVSFPLPVIAGGLVLLF